ncbi:efflux RND transporter periplasmic adaptor subunit [Candidatus Gottesmanbacteria bacterium]|nr:efflux RND transporter periplasmic adaptor subunit [Candidatus Gottesmanbacteria bacterium]
MGNVINIFLGIPSWFIKRSLGTKIILIVAVLSICWFATVRIKESTTSIPQYQTTQPQKGTLIVSVTVSGQVLEANSAKIDTQASGVVRKIYVENGQVVRTGDKILDIELDLVGKQRASQALANYQSAKNALETAKVNYYTLQSDMLTKWKSYVDIAQSSTYQNPDGSPKTDTRQLPQFISTSDDWLATEGKYKNQENVVSQAQTAVNASWLTYQQTSSTVYAPISGTVTGLSLQVGSVLTSQSNTTGTAASQKIASIQTNASPIIQVDVTQIDTPKIKIGDSATLTFDAFPGKTFTGKVVSIDTIGTVNSGVTTYPAVIKLDTQEANIFSNMSASANIITQRKDNVLLVPSSSVQTQNDSSYVRVLKNGKIEQVSVETGLSSGTQIEIMSGISEGETIVTSISSITSSGGQRNQSQSPFSSFGGGGAFRMVR